MIDRIDDIRRAVEAVHGCSAKYECSFPVTEKRGEETVWEGFVESFALSQHPKAKRCYAWSFMERDEPRYVAVLELPPITSPHSALRAAIAGEQQIG